jgi:hypothetical protein
MTDPKVIIVVLRQPRKDPDEKRSDPFWEFGSFGRTRCHSSNLMNPKKIHLLTGVRLAFAQGGKEGFKLVHLTPPIHVISHGDFAEAAWSPIEMPFKYKHAPLLVDNDGNSDFPLLLHSIERTNSPSWRAKFAARFRARREVLANEITREIIEVFSKSKNARGADSIASSYVEALPYSPPCEDVDREYTYLELLKNPTKRCKPCK